MWVGVGGRPRLMDTPAGSRLEWPPPMLYLFAKALEVSGLVTLLWGLFIGVSGQGMFTGVAMMAAGVAVFYAGRRLERLGRGGGAPGGRA